MAIAQTFHDQAKRIRIFEATKVGSAIRTKERFTTPAAMAAERLAKTQNSPAVSRKVDTGLVH